MAFLQNTVTYHWYVPGYDPFLNFVTSMANTKYPPLVNSISWGCVEQVELLLHYIIVMIGSHHKLNLRRI